MKNIKNGDFVVLKQDIIFTYRSEDVIIANKGDIKKVSNIDDEGIWLDNSSFYVSCDMVENNNA